MHLKYVPHEVKHERAVAIRTPPNEQINSLENTLNNDEICRL